MTKIINGILIIFAFLFLNCATIHKSMNDVNFHYNDAKIENVEWHYVGFNTFYSLMCFVVSPPLGVTMFIFTNSIDLNTRAGFKERQKIKSNGTGCSINYMKRFLQYDGHSHKNNDSNVIFDTNKFKTNIKYLN